VEQPVPLNPVYKTGMRVPVSGFYRDQHGVVTYHEAHHTFPPCIGRKGECAFRTREK
jgi:hypothetical protein